LTAKAMDLSAHVASRQARTPLERGSNARLRELASASNQY